MPLKERKEAPPLRPAVHGASCSVGDVYRDNLHDDEELDILDTLLYEEEKNAREVWVELHNGGYTKVALSTVNKHRGGTCRCFTIDKDLWCLECRRDHARCSCGSNA